MSGMNWPYKSGVTATAVQDGRRLFGRQNFAKRPGVRRQAQRDAAFGWSRVFFILDGIRSLKAASRPPQSTTQASFRAI
jgi:hypothetical protein